MGCKYCSIALLLLLLLSSCDGKTKENLCVFEKGPCIKRIDSTEFVLSVKPLPLQALKETRFILTVRGSKRLPDQIILDLSMPGMYMGINQVVLKRIEEGRYEGTGVIPRCPSGKTLWEAELLLPERIVFRFNVRY